MQEFELELFELLFLLALLELPLPVFDHCDALFSLFTLFDEDERPLVLELDLDALLLLTFWQFCSEELSELLEEPTLANNEQFPAPLE